VIDPSAGKDSSKRIVIINPDIVDRQGSQRGEEGRLCFPGFIEQITYSMSVKLEARDSMGATVHLRSEGLLSRALQHEIDHFNGTSFIRRMSALKRELVRRKIRKLLQAGDWQSSQ
jgi:peptide deformylase